MTKEERDIILKGLADERNYYERECSRHIAEEYGKVKGADYMIQRFFDIIKTEVEHEESEG